MRTTVILVGAAMALCACASRMEDQGLLYDQLQDQDVQLAATTLQRSLEQGRNGETLSWRNAATGATGSITPQGTFLTSGGAYCRAYDETIVIGARSAQSRNTACRDQRGNWIWI
jgi:surface antigen